MPSPSRPLASLLLTLVGAAVIATAAVGSWRAPHPAPLPVASPVTCPDTPVRWAGRHVSPGTRLPDLRCADLTGAVLDGVDLTQADLTGARATRASFRGAVLDQADLAGADLRGAVLEHASLIQADAPASRWNDADLVSADLSQATLTGADLRGADLTGAGLVQANLDRADLRGATLWWVDTIQASTWRTYINPAEMGIVQLPYLFAAVLLIFMAIRTIRGARVPYGSRFDGAALVRQLVIRAVVYVAAAVVISLILFNLGALWIARPVLPLSVAGVTFLLAVTVARLTPRRPVSQATTASPTLFRRAKATMDD